MDIDDDEGTMENYNKKEVENNILRKLKNKDRNIFNDHNSFPKFNWDKTVVKRKIKRP